MKTSLTGRKFIEVFEGKILHTYDDGTGVLTIGYGHTSAAGPPIVERGQVVTEQRADEILSSDLGKVEQNVTNLIHGPMKQYEFDALVSFDFNTGALGRSSIKDKINSGNPGGAMQTLLQYDHAGGRQMAGLTRRRQAEKLMYLGQVDAAMQLAGGKTGTMPQAPHPSPPPAAPSSFWQIIVAVIGAIFKRGQT